MGFVRHTAQWPVAQRAVRELHHALAEPGAGQDRLRVAERLGEHVGHHARMAAGEGRRPRRARPAAAHGDRLRAASDRRPSHSRESCCAPAAAAPRARRSRRGQPARRPATRTATSPPLTVPRTTTRLGAHRLVGQRSEHIEDECRRAARRTPCDAASRAFPGRVARGQLHGRAARAVSAEAGRRELVDELPLPAQHEQLAEVVDPERARGPERVLVAEALDRLWAPPRIVAAELGGLRHPVEVAAARLRARCRCSGARWSPRRGTRRSTDRATPSCVGAARSPPRPRRAAQPTTCSSPSSPQAVSSDADVAAPGHDHAQCGEARSRDFRIRPPMVATATRSCGPWRRPRRRCGAAPGRVRAEVDAGHAGRESRRLGRAARSRQRGRSAARRRAPRPPRS